MKPVEEPLIMYLQKIIRFSVRVLAVLMTFVIFWGVFDVVWELYRRLLEPPVMLLDINDILATFGAFLAVLIAIEIFANITVYLKDEVIHLKIVLATALMAIARKVIIFDYSELSYHYIYATAAVVVALSFGYWLVIVKGETGENS
ncbi:MAG: phosphate-starvation-inducible PsiE family protein [Candidatus Omnitrophica bacterium]|nr:phosphate-starvation-inducible PsiE family protein [Candidatus Omnitrophota bacterium]